MNPHRDPELVRAEMASVCSTLQRFAGVLHLSDLLLSDDDDMAELTEPGRYLVEGVHRTLVCQLEQLLEARPLPSEVMSWFMPMERQLRVATIALHSMLHGDSGVDQYSTLQIATGALESAMEAVRGPSVLRVPANA